MSQLYKHIIPILGKLVLLLGTRIINFAIGGALVFVNIPTFILMQREISNEYRGRVNGLLGTTSLSIQPLGMVLGGLFLIISIIFSRLDRLKEYF